MVDSKQDLSEKTDNNASENIEKSQGETFESSDSEALEALNNRYLRLAADFENFRKRQAQEREALFKYGAQSTLEALLPVLDNLNRAKQTLNESSDPKMLLKSIEMLSQQLLDALKNIGLESMSPKGEIFNPERHEAVSQVENPDLPDHTIMEVYQNGYCLLDRVLRPAQVVVSVQPEGTSSDSTFTVNPGDVKNNPFHPASKSGHGNPE
jgi:molecular chaperone GrpE